ncbi:MAG: penicillin-binding protein activator [Idiomarina sp.]|nr:penicillin-binding protein activator [Idiomarina sp.]
MPKKLIACMAILVLAGCATQPSEPAPETTDIDQEPLTEVTLVPDADPREYLDRAAEAENRAQTFQYLLRASAVFFDREEWQQGAAVLSQLEDVELPQALRAQYQLLRAELLIHFEQWQSAQALLSEIEDPQDRQQRIELMQLNYQLYVGQQRHLSAGRQLVELSLYDDGDYSDAIWSHFAQVPAGYWRQSVRDTGDIMQGWSSLFSRVTLALDYRESVADALQRWQIQFPQHPASAQVQQLLDEHPWIREHPRRIAVLLPLSGQFAQQGQSIRDGVLAALSNERNEDVLFIDTSENDPEQVLEILDRENIEAVIGPLSRDYVDRMAQTLTHLDQVQPWLQLWLNRAPENYAPGLDNFFALDIDTEVESAVSYLSELGHEQILVLGTDTQRGRQLARQFEERWQQQHGPRSTRFGSYRSSTEMPDVVAQSLHVRDSASRISSVERAAGSAEIESEPRSRRDLGATYLLGDAAQARLLKPFIETNISPFATRMPVFASSAIHESAANRGRGDLDGIVFSDAPWLLPNHPQSDLLARFNRLHPNQGPAAHRLVAMGYDAMELLPRLSTMTWLPGYDHAGLTGRLRIFDNAVQRQLNWAMFESNSLTEQPRNEHTYNRDTL